MQKRITNIVTALETQTTPPAVRDDKSAALGGLTDFGVQSLILKFISSVEQIEILCLFFGDQTRCWTVREILQIVQSSEKSVIACLNRLVKSGFLASNGTTFHFAPRCPELADAALAMCTSYRERRVAITEMIYRGADQR